ncbi:hypothetical protein HZS_3010 [Henneguya salminicola]|nr:hypothetical protein HZS_3010 [Henneguya salminicola]
MRELDEKRNIYESTIFSQDQLLQKLCVQFFMFLVLDSFSNLHEEILNYFFRIVSTNMNFFHKQIIPILLLNFPILTEENRAFLLNTINPVQDQPSFCVELYNLAKDVKYFSICNS